MIRANDRISLAAGVELSGDGLADVLHAEGNLVTLNASALSMATLFDGRSVRDVA